MFVKMFSLWATKEERIFLISNQSARAMEKNLIGLCGLRSTLRHLLCINNVPRTMYHTIFQRTSGSLPQNVQVLFHIPKLEKMLIIYRSLGQLFASSDILSGEEAERMRQYYGTAYMDPDKHLKDPYGVLIKDGDLTPIQEHFQSRIQHFEGRRHEAAQELFRIRWGPTHIPVYTALLIFTLNNPGSRYKYINVAEWLVDTAKVPVDGM